MNSANLPPADSGKTRTAHVREGEREGGSEREREREREREKEREGERYHWVGDGQRSLHPVSLAQSGATSCMNAHAYAHIERGNESPPRNAHAFILKHAHLHLILDALVDLAHHHATILPFSHCLPRTPQVPECTLATQTYARKQRHKMNPRIE